MQYAYQSLRHVRLGSIILYNHYFTDVTKKSNTNVLRKHNKTYSKSCYNRFPQHKNVHFLFLSKELTAFDYHNILFFLILVKFSLTMRSFQGRCMYINRFLSELSLTHLYLIIIA